MRKLDVPQSGSLGNMVASRNRFGSFVRERVSPNQPGTPAQRAVWANMTALSRLWNELEEERWDAWRRLAESVHSRPNLRQSGPLDGCLLFKKLNRVLCTCGREPLLDPPPPPAFGPNPAAGFEVRSTSAGLSFKLLASPKVRWETRPPLEDIMVFGWAPCNAGAAKNNRYAFLGLLPAPVNGECDITAMYLAKLKEWRRLADRRYQVPLPDSRVFIRAWQQVNGWENELGMFRASALVPATGSRRVRERAAALRKALAARDGK
jgi:hypothetical protein